MSVKEVENAPEEQGAHCFSSFLSSLWTKAHKEEEQVSAVQRGEQQKLAGTHFLSSSFL